jgi:type III secretory pathway component EscT
MSGLLQAVVTLLEAQGVDLTAWALGWARVLPLVTLLPAFGARLLPPVGRVVLGLALGSLLAPALPAAATLTGNAWPLQLLLEALRGLPIALGASALLWAASMAGGLGDELRSSQVARISMLEPDTPALGVLFGLFAAIGFLSLGGVTTALEHLLVAPGDLGHWTLSAVSDLVGSVEIALALAAPLLGLVIVVEVAGALIARAASPAHIQALLAPLRAFAILFGLALALEGMFHWLLELLP